MRKLTRRSFLKHAGIGGVFLLSSASPFRLVEDVFSEEIREVSLTAAVTPVDIGTGRTFMAWTYNGTAPGPEIRVKEGDTLRVTLRNNLPEGTTIHWHGLPVPNRMDGVPDVTQDPVQTGASFIYEFEATPPGTYVYHSHASYQLDRGLYGALIIEPKQEERSYDREYTLLLDDWATVDGGGPEASRQGRVRSGMGTGMMGSGQQDPEAPLLEPLYDEYTINGKVFRASPPFTVKRGERVRLRIINPSAATLYTLRIAGHSLTVTHTDGRPVVPFTVDALRVGMGERYDAELTANNPGRWYIYTLRDGSPAGGRQLGSLVYQGITATSFNNDTLSRFRVSEYRLFDGVEETYVMPVSTIDRAFRMTLSGGVMSPYWTINGKVYPDTDTLSVIPGESVRFEYSNLSMASHPMHLHGHFFEVAGSGLSTGIRIRKDTLIIPSMGSGAIEFVADNPGHWLHHCHNLYHHAGGMANVMKVA